MTGEALDYKTPLLRSQQAMGAQAERILKLFGHKDFDHVVSFCGPEQEYFLIDRHFFLARPDLINAGRTLFGAKPPKGQEFDDHYFGAIPERVLGFMMDTERELFKLGIPAKTRHNEVAPGQFEIAPMFERANIAADHQQLLMTTFKTIAKKHGMECLFHEKPFAGVNGSGKHVNFSMGNAAVRQPAGARRHPARERPVPGVLRGGDPRRAQVLAACCGCRWPRPPTTTASAPTRHRRRSSRSSSAISSPTCSSRSPRVRPRRPRARARMIIGVDTLPVLPTDPGDRNRTSPFAFTGNRFEFRAPGSGQTINVPMIILNTIMADSLDYMATVLEKAVGEGEDFDMAVQKLLTEIITEHGAVVFNGDGYSENWQIEAAERGLPNLKTTLDSIPELVKPEAIEVFEKYGVFNARELHSRDEVRYETYVLTVGVEAKLTLEMGSTVILPAAIRYQTELASERRDAQGGRYRAGHRRCWRRSPRRSRS